MTGRGTRETLARADGKTHTVAVSGRRTEILIKGKSAARRALKPGMTCEIRYPGDGEEAQQVVCP